MSQRSVCAASSTTLALVNACIILYITPSLNKAILLSETPSTSEPVKARFRLRMPTRIDGHVSVVIAFCQHAPTTRSNNLPASLLIASKVKNWLVCVSMLLGVHPML